MNTLEPAWTRPRLVRYRPGAGLVIGAVGLAALALSLFRLRWIDADGGRFVDISRSIRQAGTARVGDALLYGYGAWGGFVFAALAAVFVVAACLPLPASSSGNTWPRLVGAVVAAIAAVTHTLFVRDLFAGNLTPQFGAWLGLIGYLLAGSGIALGARRISATYDRVGSDDLSVD